jgi:hypothetical protein
MACIGRRIALLFALAGLVPGLVMAAVKRRQFNGDARARFDYAQRVLSNVGGQPAR